jgi:hypothetical protein
MQHRANVATSCERSHAPNDLLAVEWLARELAGGAQTTTQPGNAACIVTHRHAEGISVLLELRLQMNDRANQGGHPIWNASDDGSSRPF